MFFNAGCNKQVFSPSPQKVLTQIRLVVFEKNAKTTQLRRTPIPKNVVIEPKVITTN